MSQTYNCIGCGRELESLYDVSDLCDGGSVDWIVAGFGSCHDTDRFKIATCDDCLKTKSVEHKKWWEMDEQT